MRLKHLTTALTAGILFLTLSGHSSVHAQSSPEPKCSAFLEGGAFFSWKGISGRGYERSAPAMWEQSAIAANVTKGPCSLALVIDGFGSSLSGQGFSLAFTLAERVGGSDLSASAADPLSSPLTGASGVSEEIVFPLFLSIAPGQTVKAGEYAVSVPVKLYDIGNGLPQMLDEGVVEIVVTVGPELSVAAKGSVGRSIDVDLGDVEQGFRHDMDFIVNSNAPVSVSLLSEGKGHLMHEMADIGITYTARMEGTLFDLGSGMDERWFDLPVGQDELLSLSLEGRSPIMPVAGRYADTLTVIFRSDM